MEWRWSCKIRSTNSRSKAPLLHQAGVANLPQPHGKMEVYSLERIQLSGWENTMQSIKKTE
jgi:hypothetical protein